jgi:hypothetical protein
MGEADSFEAHQEELRKAYKAGRKRALLQSIEMSILHRKPLSDWASTAFDEAYAFVMMGAARSWDDVFGEPHPPAKHLRSVQLDNQKYGIYRRVRELHNQGAPIDDGLFELVAKECALGGKTVIKNLYYEVDRLLKRLDKEAG